MEGAYKENDLPEVKKLSESFGFLAIQNPTQVKIEGTLHKISADMSKDDYNTLIALVTTNFQEVRDYNNCLRSCL